MNDLLASLHQSVATATAEAAAATAEAAVEAVRVRLLGRKGLLTEAMKELGKLSPAERPEFGRVLNQLKSQLSALLDERAEGLRRAALAQRAGLDVSLPGRPLPVGHKHPLSVVTDECVAIFRRMGFVVADGPDIEDEYHNFDALNTPPDHPARDDQDTLFLFDGRLLRSQTSTVQVRVMESRPPPVRIVSPGRCYRRDTPDATHSATFHQIEGLYIDRSVTLADLRGTLLEFARELFGRDVRTRLRPHFFPFTEPSLEWDVWYDRGNGKPSWLELAGAGMVDPNVLRAVGYDPEEVTGFAFGMGIERMAMVFFGIPDIRLFYDNDVRFLRQF